jgi:hypothetical protein
LLLLLVAVVGYNWHQLYEIITSIKLACNMNIKLT